MGYQPQVCCNWNMIKHFCWDQDWCRQVAFLSSLQVCGVIQPISDVKHASAFMFGCQAKTLRPSNQQRSKMCKGFFAMLSFYLTINGCAAKIFWGIIRWEWTDWKVDVETGICRDFYCSLEWLVLLSFTKEMFSVYLLRKEWLNWSYECTQAIRKFRKMGTYEPFHFQTEWRSAQHIALGNSIFRM